jgi:hypothetical protein
MKNASEQPKPKMTREQFIHEVRALAVALIPAPPVRERLLAAKLVYGAGPGGVRGLCYYAAWQRGEQPPVEFVEVAATGEESTVQLAGTTIHETAHVLAGRGTGHGVEWKAACRMLGLRHAEAGGQAYSEEHFAPELWKAIAALPEPNDGKPMFTMGAGSGVGLPVAKFRRCPLGIGTRGGKSRGAGSGSRMRLYLCGCTPDPKAGITNKVRVASDDWQATCSRCGRAFERVAGKADESAA